MTLDRDTRRLLAEIAFAAAHHRLRKEVRTFLDLLDLLIEDAEDREATRAYLHFHLGELHEATACLPGCRPDLARTLSQMIALQRSAGSSARPLN